MPLVGKKQPGAAMNWAWDEPGQLVEVPWPEALELTKIYHAGFYIVEDDDPRAAEFYGRDQESVEEPAEDPEITEVVARRPRRKPSADS